MDKDPLETAIRQVQINKDDGRYKRARTYSLISIAVSLKELNRLLEQLIYLKRIEVSGSINKRDKNGQI